MRVCAFKNFKQLLASFSILKAASPRNPMSGNQSHGAHLVRLDSARLS